MQCLTRFVFLLSAIATLTVTISPAASAKPHPPVNCQSHNAAGQCIVTVGAPGHGGHPPTAGGGSGRRQCLDGGKPVPCSRGGLGTWDAGLDCYLALMSPQPPKTDPLWHGHTTGAIYLCTSWPPRSTGTTELWLATPPTGPDPRTLALRAEKTLRLPQPSGDRSPSQDQQFHGYPFTYVNLWTWYWTDPASWQTRTATARAGGVSATVTVTPKSLTFDPGDGSAAMGCAGPGRAWTSADGDGNPTDGGCGYRYRSATSQPVTSTQSIRWAVTWRASDGESGTLPDLTTSRSGQLMVLQVESVVTR
jgi:hypothetical protein